MAIRPVLVLLRWLIMLRDIRHHPARLWHWSARWPVFGVIVALAVGVTAIGEYAIGIGLILLSALSLISKLWHGERGVFLRFIGTFGIALGLLVALAIVWDAKADNPWTRLPHAWHRLLAVREPVLPVSLPHPQFIQDIPFALQYRYRNGMIVDGIRWHSDMREYIFTIENGMESGEISNFREHLLLPFPVLRMQVVSSLGCDGVSVSVGNGSNGGNSPQGTVVDKGEIVTTVESGTNDVSIAATKMLPRGKIVIKMVGSSGGAHSSIPGFMIYSSEFTRLGQLAHYGRMVRYITANNDGVVSIGEEFHKKGHALTVPLSWSFTVTPKIREQFMPPFQANRLANELLDRDDDE